MEKREETEEQKKRKDEDEMRGRGGGKQGEGVEKAAGLLQALLSLTHA